MADPGSFGLGPRLDIQQLFIDAQHRWLRPAEICEILRNYQKFHIASEPPNRPSSGSLFLFDRKVLRYFRKDGHNWRKKKDGKTVKEAHEKLKVGSVDVLHCYYAHGEENENFQRRSYWMLEQELMHIVFVHYLEVKGSRTSSSPLNSFSTNHTEEPSGNTDSTGPTSTLTSACEDADSADSHQANSRYQSHKSPQIQNGPVNNVNNGLWRSSRLHEGQSSTSKAGTVSYTRGDGLGNNNNITESRSLGAWQEVLEQYSTGHNSLPSPMSTSPNQPVSMAIGGRTVLGNGLDGGVDAEKNFDNSVQVQSNWQIPDGRSSLHMSDGTVDPSLGLDLPYDWESRLFDQKTHDVNAQNPLESFYSLPNQQSRQLGLENFHAQLANTEPQHPTLLDFENDLFVEGSSKHTFSLKQSLLNGEEGLKKVDSFSRWISKEFGEVDDLNVRSSSAIGWSTEDCGNVVDDSSLSPSLSQDQLFSIIDFSPKWSYADLETEVHIIGTFLKGQEEVAKCNWSCMFGEVEVPAEVMIDGVLCCHSPRHDVARVPFYITNSNRLACSEVREFDYRLGPSEDVNIDVYGSTTELHFHKRLERLLCARSSCSSDSLFEDAIEKRKLISEIISLKEEEENYQMTEPSSVKRFSGDEVKRQLLESQMKEKLYSWLVHKISESGKGPSVLDDDGQGVLHFAAALGFDWAIILTVQAGVSINFRDVNGWTALHWAAFFGREQTVAVLVKLGAATGALTDPSPEFPLGRTPADLASENGHKGISGFLAESSLTNFLKGLTVNDLKEDGSLDVSRMTAVQTISERTATPVNYGDVQDELSLKDSLTAVRNATQAAGKIFQVYRMQSFQWKMQAEHEHDNDEFGISDERALSLIASRTSKSAHSDGIAHAAAIQIQKKFRGWKKRKEFLIIRQRIVKLQAHVRGHQVRKQYKPIIWSVGILEKVILRWRRKGSGLRGFRRDALTKESNLEGVAPKEDSYDILKEGKKQNEERMQHALTRVKSMIHYPEARAQYRRLLNVVEGFPEAKGSDMVLSTSEGVADDGDEELFDLEPLLDDDTFMSIAFE